MRNSFYRLYPQYRCFLWGQQDTSPILQALAAFPAAGAVAGAFSTVSGPSFPMPAHPGRCSCAGPLPLCLPASGGNPSPDRAPRHVALQGFPAAAQGALLLTCAPLLLPSTVFSQHRRETGGGIHIGPGRLVTLG